MSLTYLTTLGFTTKESHIYELLLSKGEIPVSSIIRELKLKRATAYKSLYALKDKGLVQMYDKGNILHVKPESPHRLLELSEQQLQTQERTRADLRASLPDLVSSYLLSVEKPVVSTFQGVDGLKEIYLDTLREKKPIYAALAPGTIEPELIDWLEHVYAKQRAKLNIHATVIVTSEFGSKYYRKRDDSELRTTIEVPASQFPFKQELNIYGDKVAFMDYKKGSSLIGVIINHPATAQTMKALFDLAWQNANSHMK